MKKSPSSANVTGSVILAHSKPSVEPQVSTAAKPKTSRSVQYGTLRDAKIKILRQ